MFSLCLCVRARRAGEEGGRALLVAAIGVAAAAQRLLLGPWNTGHVHQECVHHEDPAHGNPPIRRAKPDQQVGEPVQPFEEVVGVAGPCPQSGVAHSAAVFRSCTKAGKLGVGHRFATEREHPESDAGEVVPGERRAGRAGSGPDRQREQQSPERLHLEKTKHEDLHPRAESFAQIAVSPVFAFRSDAAQQVRAKTHSPHANQRRQQPLALSSSVVRAEREPHADHTGAEGPGDVDSAGVVRAVLHEPQRAHHRGHHQPGR